MIACDRDRGRIFLAGQLSPHEEAAFSDHLETCSNCVAWLETDAGDIETWRIVQEWSQGEAHCLLSNLPNGDFCGAEPTNVVQLSVQQLAPLLAPSDDPAYIGRIGPYEITGIVGRGGMGIVLKGFDRSLMRFVAIKVLDPVFAHSSSPRRRFEREAKAMAAISHEHVVPIYAVDCHQELPYFVMEYIAGEPLDRRLVQHGPFDAVGTVRVAMQVAAALSAAHAQGLVHRDIKPGNILLDRGTERVRVADFGLARVADEANCTRSGFVAGTPQYMSPEQVRGEACDAQSDLFSLGSVMYAMCTGHAPFRAESVYGVMQRIVHDIPRPIREQNAHVPQWLDLFIVKLMNKAPSSRIQTAKEVREILQAELAYLENPTQCQSPPRPWMPDVGNRSLGRLGYLLSIATLLGMTLVTSYTLPIRNTESAKRTKSTVARSHQTLDERASAASGVPLWEIDGTDQIRVRIEKLSVNDTSHSISLDGWHRDLNELQARIKHLSLEPY